MPDFGSTRNGGSRRTAPFYRLIGPPPKCQPGDVEAAQTYLNKIVHALGTGSWNPTHANRLRELRRLWAFRASGQDLRFNLVGTRDGRLPLETEQIIRGTRLKRMKAMKKQLQPQDTRNLPYHEWRDDTRATGYGTGFESTQAQGLDGTTDADEPEAGVAWAPGPREYIIPGQDSHGHSVRCWTRVMPAHHRAMQALKAHPNFAFRTIGDLFRWCIVHGIEELNKRAKLPGVRSAMHQAEAIRKVLTDQAYYQDYADVFDSMAQIIDKHASRNEVGMAARLVGQIRNHIEGMSEPFWRDLWMKELETRFGRFLTTSGAQMLDGGEE